MNDLIAYLSSTNRPDKQADTFTVVAEHAEFYDHVPRSVAWCDCCRRPVPSFKVDHPQGPCVKVKQSRLHIQEGVMSQR